MADVTDSVTDEVVEDDFEEVGSDYVLKSSHSCLQEKGKDQFPVFYELFFYNEGSLYGCIL